MEGLEDAGKLVFSTADAKAIGKRRGMTPAQVLLLTSRLARAGWIRRIKRGLYATTGKLPGSMAPHDFTVALALASPSALGHRTALHFHGLSDQIPRTITCTTTSKVVTRRCVGAIAGAASGRLTDFGFRSSRSGLRGSSGSRRSGWTSGRRSP
ncbi:MAG: type IV toxin-antitoxin system AbiEi family antitoxin domain-containing protein [Holophagales bacterium]|nr:type IV toxin-antitoxin system AbiEi family antitoxin domain-containing protein [Holophagales bacterium]